MLEKEELKRVEWNTFLDFNWIKVSGNPNPEELKIDQDLSDPTQ